RKRFCCRSTVDRGVGQPGSPCRNLLIRRLPIQGEESGTTADDPTAQNGRGARGRPCAGRQKGGFDRGLDQPHRGREGDVLAATRPAMTIAVGVGLMEFPFRDAQAYWNWVDLCEAGGVDSVWQTDRIVSSEPMLECMTTMAALAGRTRRIKFGMNVVSLALRDPVLIAKQCATIDVLSNGRLLPAFGIGSPRAPEWAALNLDTSTRGRRTDEGLEIIGRLWREHQV